MNMHELYIIYPLIALLGLVVGSHVHVIIDRLPRMLGLAPLPTNFTKKEYNIAWPRSHCPHCGTVLKFYDLIPLFSYAQLRGKCRYCKQPISWTYPVVELLTAVIFIIIYLHLGLSLAAAAAIFFLCSLLILAILDYQYHVLPDQITLPILWLGLLVNVFDLFVPLEDAVIGAIAGYLSLWTVYWVHNWITGKTGLGYGDFKLLALLGAWLGWHALPITVVIASFLGLLYALILYWRGHLSRTTPLPFGSFLAIAGGILLLC
ncbi:MAG: prepilin peptidase [Gammaproteobacteria bacterium]